MESLDAKPGLMANALSAQKDGSLTQMESVYQLMICASLTIQLETVRAAIRDIILKEFPVFEIK